MRGTLGARLNSVTVHVGRALRTGAVGVGLAIEHRSALSVIVFAGPMRMSDLARAEQVSAGNVTRTVKILEERGLVRRVADPKDGRATLVEATPAGRQLFTRGRDERARRIDAALRRMPAAAVRRIAGAVGDLEMLVHILGSASSKRER